jgi:hypothetical protein
VVADKKRKVSVGEGDRRGVDCLVILEAISEPDKKGTAPPPSKLTVGEYRR